MNLLTLDQQRTLIEHAMRDRAFKQALLENPRTAVQNRLGVTIPADETLHVVQGEAQTLTVVIPQAPADWPQGLSVEAAMERLRREQPALEGKAQRAVEAQTHLIARAWQDEAFKQRLLRDPKGTAGQELGVDLPDALSLRFVADDAANQYVILPPEMEGAELTDEQLEQVAGGEVVTTTVTAVVITSAATAASFGITIIAVKVTSW